MEIKNCGNRYGEITKNYEKLRTSHQDDVDERRAEPVPVVGVRVVDAIIAAAQLIAGQGGCIRLRYQFVFNDDTKQIHRALFCAFSLLTLLLFFYFYFIATLLLLDITNMSNLPTLVAARYGSASKTANGTNGTNGTNGHASHTAVTVDALTTILSHKSVRHFVPGQALPDNTLDVLVAAAQSAPTSSNLQAWSVVAVQDSDRKARLAALSGNRAFVREAPLVLVFTADLHRAEVASAAVSTEAAPSKGEALQYTELFLVAALDAAFAAQNVFVAAEALGLGGCYVGAARNHPRDVAALLDLPSRVVGLFALAIGVPDHSVSAVTAPVKPRLPAAEVLHHETWDDSRQQQNFADYDTALAAFNDAQRLDQPVWTKRAAARVATVASLHGRHELKEILQERNFQLL